MALLDPFRPKWKHSDPKIRLAAVGSLEDEMLLFAIALHDGDGQVRNAAIAKLTSPGYLAVVAQEAPLDDEKAAAAEKLVHPEQLSELARIGVEKVRLAAVRKLSDPGLLAEIAEQDDSRDVCLAAINNPHLTDSAVFAGIIKAGSDKDITIAAFRRLSDPRVISEIAAHAEAPRVRMAAVENLADEAVLVRIARTDPDGDVRKAAFARLRGSLQSESRPWIDPVAVQALRDQGLLRDIACEAGDRKVRSAAVSGIMEPGLLVEVVKTAGSKTDGDVFPETRLSAVRKLDDETRLLDIIAHPWGGNLFSAAIGRSNAEVTAAAQRKIEILRKAPSPIVTAGPSWECPRCGALQPKSGLDVLWRAGEPIDRVSGAERCWNPDCRAEQAKADIYGGRYDVDCGRVSVVVFCIGAYESPSDAKAYCRHALGKRYEGSTMERHTIIGYQDDLDTGGALRVYRRDVNEGRLLDHGRLFDSFCGQGQDRRRIVTLVFVD